MEQNLQEIQKLFSLKEEETAIRYINVFSESLLGNNVEGHSLWSMGINYINDLLKLFGKTGNIEKINLTDIDILLDNEQAIKQLLETTNVSDYQTLNGVMSLNETVKDMLYKYIREKITNEKLKQWRNNLSVNSQSQINYTNIEDVVFDSGEQTEIHTAKNVLFNNLKVSEIEIIGELELGRKILDDIKEKYKENLFELFATMAIDDYNHEWADETISKDKLMSYLTEPVSISVVCSNNEFNMTFGLKDEFADVYGGHNPILVLHTDKDYKFTGYR